MANNEPFLQKGKDMDIQIPYPKNYTELIKAHDLIIDALDRLIQAPERPRASRQAKVDFADWKLMAWGMKIILDEDLRILRALEKEDHEYIDAFNQKLKEM